MLLGMKYRDENDFIRKLRSLRTYCPLSHKHFIFQISKEGFPDAADGTYSKDIFTSKEFKFVYGQIRVIYSIKNKIVTIEDLEPSKFLIDGYKTKLETYRGMYYRNNQDKFKIDLLLSMKESKRREIT